MKTFASILIAAVLFGAGFFWGRHPVAESKFLPLDIASDVLKASEFNHAYISVSECEVILEQLDSGRIEDAKHMLRLLQDGDILGMENILDQQKLSLNDFIALRDLNASIHSSTNTMQRSADQILARISQYRANHPWKYSGNLSQADDPQVKAKLAEILKRASESQKQ